MSSQNKKNTAEKTLAAVAPPGVLTTNPYDAMLDAKQAAVRLGWSVRTLYRRTKSRKLTYIKDDGKLKFKQSDLDLFIERRTVRAA
jgi:excisionase family DNA binding protein